METSSEYGPLGEAQTKINNLFWTDKEANLVAQFFSGNDVSISENSHDKTIIWQKLNDNTDFEPSDGQVLLQTAQKLDTLLFVIPQSLSDLSTEETSVFTKESYEWMARKRSQTLLQVTAQALVKSGIWDENEHRKMVGLGKLRRPDKTGFSEEEFYQDTILKKGYAHPSDGGPDVLSVIYAPRFEHVKDISDMRQRGSLGHEVNHAIRALVNQNVWKGFEEIADLHQLPVVLSEKTATKEYAVGSNQQGSEAIGELLSLFMQYKFINQSEPTVNDMLPFFYRTFKSHLELRTKNPEKNIRYFAANIALMSHLSQLSELGHGDIDIKDLVSVGALGFVSLEKLPSLLKLGVIDQDKFKKMREVITEIENWLTSSK